LVDRDLAAILKSHRLPGGVVAAFSRDRILATGVAGVREYGKTTPITLNDRFNIGSNGKAMLATTLAFLVEGKQLSWDSRPAEILVPANLQPAYRAVNLTSLLNHHAGLPSFDDDGSAEWKAWIASPREGPARTPVQRFALWVLTQPPSIQPGTEMLYSNAGYSTAAAMAEQVTGMDWKDLMRSRLFAGLGMDADFGLPAPSSRQPSGHYETKQGVQVQSLDDATPPVLQPAGDVQLSVLDYVKFLQFHLRGLAGADGALKASTVAFMHTPTGKAGLGWGIRDFDGAKASVHSGSAGSYYAVTILIPSRNLGVAVLLNAGGERAEAACSEAAKKFLAQFKAAPR
jgi:D-alanyl-D-alanine carboxypeptidase